MTDDLQQLAHALAAATRPRCELGHDRISLNTETGRPDCPVPEHTPTRIIDLADASVIWEADDHLADSTSEPAAENHGEVLDA